MQSAVADDRLRIPVAPVFLDLLPSHRYKGARGGRASAKSNFFGDTGIDCAVSYPGLRMVCIREVQKSLKRSSKQLLEDKIHHYGLLSRGFVIRREEIETPGGGVIIFQGMQDHTADSIKSLEGFDVFWVEEAQNLSQRSLDLLTPTARRTQRSVMAQPELWFSWNPNKVDDPIEKFFKSEPPDSKCVTANWRDNPWFPPELLKELTWMRHRDPQKYNHVWEGGYLARSEALVFTNWKVQEFEAPQDVVWHWGADWGFSVDPTVLIGCFIIGRTLYIRHEAWKVGCEIDRIPALFDSVNPDIPQFARKWSITGDSERPDTISYLRRNGYPQIVGARKGAGSVEDGIEFVKGFDIVVHPDCVHTQDELSRYSYKVDKLTEKVLPVLIDKKNHTIDSIRYAVEDVRWAVAGAGHAADGVVAGGYDGHIVPLVKRPSSIVIADFGHGSAAAAFPGHEYDGGLTDL